MAQSTFTVNGHEFRFSDKDIVNLDDWIPQKEYNPHRVIPILLHDHGVTLCVIFADNLGDALDIAADGGHLDRYLIDEEDQIDYCEVDDKTGKPLPNTFGENEQVDFLGNDGRAFNIESLGWVELPNPRRSFCAQFNVMQEAKVAK
jgi:hypothetical protein